MSRLLCIQRSKHMFDSPLKSNCFQFQNILPTSTLAAVDMLPVALVEIRRINLFKFTGDTMYQSLDVTRHRRRARLALQSSTNTAKACVINLVLFHINSGARVQRRWHSFHRASRGKKTCTLRGRHVWLASNRVMQPASRNTAGITGKVHRTLFPSVVITIRYRLKSV